VPAVVPEVAPEVEPSIVADGVLKLVELDAPFPAVLTTEFWPPIHTLVFELAAAKAGLPSLVADVCVLVDVATDDPLPVPWASAEASEFDSSAAQIPQMDSSIINIVNSLFITNSSHLSYLCIFHLDTLED